MTEEVRYGNSIVQGENVYIDRVWTAIPDSVWEFALKEFQRISQESYEGPEDDDEFAEVRGVDVTSVYFDQGSANVSGWKEDAELAERTLNWIETMKAKKIAAAQKVLDELS